MIDNVEIQSTERALLLAHMPSEQRRTVLASPTFRADPALVQDLAQLYIEAISGDLPLALGAAQALSDVAHSQPTPASQAYAAWVAGMVALQLDGRPEQAISLIDTAAAGFVALGEFGRAAATQSSKLFALALLGRYDEAIHCGEQALTILNAAGDRLGAGKIEQNLGNIYHRRDQYQRAETHYRAAQVCFAAISDARMLAFAENGLANVLTLQHRPNEALGLYLQAMEHAAQAGANVTQAEIACNLGVLALSTGRYADALAYLERSRQRYAELAMPNEAALSELELADAYLALNMAPAAVTSYARVIEQLHAQGLRAEVARAYAGHGRACLLNGQLDQARELSEQARALYAEEGNAVGAALATMTLAQIAYLDQAYAPAVALAAAAEQVLAASHAHGYLLLSRWLHGEACRMLGQGAEARRLLTATLHEANPDAPQIAQRCHASLGLLALQLADHARAETHLRQACDLIEGLRATLPAEDLRVAFIADKLAPFLDLARLYLNDPHGDRTAEALTQVERARARALLDLLHQDLDPLPPANPAERELRTAFETVRDEVRWFDSQLSRLNAGDPVSAGLQAANLRHELLEREAQLRELGRRINQQRPDAFRHFQLDLPQLQGLLGTSTALVEYVAFDDELLAFVVDDQGLRVTRHLASVNQVNAALAQLRFQLGSLRYGVRLGATAEAQLTQRTQQHLHLLYQLVLAPLEAQLGARALVIVPHRELSYLPFHALYDGTQYVIERREVSYAPSAQVFQTVAAHPMRPLRRALLLGVPDERTPRLADEIATLSALLPQAIRLEGAAATSQALRTHGATADLIHLACHGEFRPDSPLLSALHLADGPLTASAIYQIQLGAELAVLSACETGVSTISPGDEILGLVRGFFAAGVPALVVSLWAVDDDSTTALMLRFYQALLAGDRPVTALRTAQIAILREHPHPFHWAPFTLIGRQ